MREKQTKPTLMPFPCPFCGQEPITQPQNPEREGYFWGEVCCVNVDCAVQPSVKDGEHYSDERGTGAYIDCAIARWNKRPNK